MQYIIRFSSFSTFANVCPLWYLGIEPFLDLRFCILYFFGHSSLILLNLYAIDTICATWRKRDCNFSAFLAVNLPRLLSISWFEPSSSLALPPLPL